MDDDQATSRSVADGTKRRLGWRLRLSSLRVRLTIAVAIVAAVGLTASSVLLVRLVEFTVIRAAERTDRVRLEHIRQQIERGVAVDKIDAPDLESRFYVRRVRPDGKQLFLDPDRAGDRPLAAPLLDEQRGDGHMVVRLSLESPHDGPLMAVAVRPLDSVRRSIATLTRALWVGVPVAVALLTLAAFWVIGRTLAPVREMTIRAASIADATSGDRIVVPKTQDEVAELARTLNGMLDRLARGSIRQRQFVSDASHELRSPIAATRALLEVALAHPNHADQSVNVQGALAETLRLETLVANLLRLAKLDESYASARVELDLDDVVLEEAARPRAVPVDTTCVRAVKVNGDRDNLSQLVRNLLDNAARHATSGVAVTTERAGDEVVLIVDDDGPGIPAADRQRVFERFTRLAPSRARSSGGSGIGLALVKRIAEQHGGTVHAGVSPSRGARIEVRLRELV